MYTNILVPVSFEEDRDAAGALAIAKALSAEGGKITLLHVIEQVPPYAAEFLPPMHWENTRQAAADRLAALKATVPGSEVHITEGQSGRTIVDWAKRNDIDCIVIASHRPGMQDYLLGSTAARVVRHAACAVHVIR